MENTILGTGRHGNGGRRGQVKKPVNGEENNQAEQQSDAERYSAIEPE
jgi:hypothetical protein